MEEKTAWTSGLGHKRKGTTVPLVFFSQNKVILRKEKSHKKIVKIGKPEINW